jgi:hypothetical protein
MGDYLTANSVLMCPHGGMVSAVATNSHVTLGGAQIVLATDTFTIGGCAFMIGPSPHPCVQVQWIVTALRGTAGGAQPLTMDSVGLCVAADNAPQGSVLIQTTQARVSGL